MIIVFGGAFNPPTIAHKEIYYHIKKTINFDKFIYLPVSNIYSKSNLISNFHRLNMLNLMIQDMEDAYVSELEMTDSNFKGTYQSLLRIKEEFNDNDVAFVIGADNLKDINNWKNTTKLLSEFKFIVINRNNLNLLKYIKDDKILCNYINNFNILTDFNVQISSTAFRETFDPSYLTDKVFDYIMTNELY